MEEHEDVSWWLPFTLFVVGFLGFIFISMNLNEKQFGVFLFGVIVSFLIWAKFARNMGDW